MLRGADPARREALGATLRDTMGRAEFLAGLDNAFGAHILSPPA